MKTIKNIFAGILVVSAVMSCSRIEINSVHPSESQEPEMVPVTVTVSREDVKDVDSKVYITGTGSFKWKSGDQISLFAGAKNNSLENSTEDGVVAEFNGSVPAESGFPQYALYPYQKNAALNGDGSITATLPKVQTVVEAGDFYQCPEALLSVGKLDDAGSQLQLKNVFSLVMITVPEGTSFESITLLSNNGEALSGTVSVNPVTGECTVVSGDPTVTIKPASGTLAAGNYMIAVLPGTLASGIKVVVMDNSDSVKQRNNGSTIEFNRNAGLKMPEALLSNLNPYFSINLTSASDLIAWAQFACAIPKDKTITLAKDITLTSEQADAYASAHNFYGTFDGQNHKISGLTCPLFGDMQGIVKDLKVEANIVYDGTLTSQMKGKNTNMGILSQSLKHELNSAAKVENVTTSGSVVISNADLGHGQYVGGICGGSNGVPIVGCTNKATITVHGRSNAKLLVGGISGVQQGDTNGNIKDCKNEAAITVSNTAASGTASSDYVAAGGIVGAVIRAITMDNCDNSGAIVNSAACATAFYTAGVVGNWDVASQKDKTADIKNCDNTGKVTDDSQYATAVDHITAGVVATINASTPADVADAVATSNIHVTACTNSVLITNTAAKAKTSVNGGILGDVKQFSVIESCENKSTGGSSDRVFTQSTEASTQIAMGGIVAKFAGNAYIHNCQNQGRVNLKEAKCADVRMGGIAGLGGHAELVAGEALVTYEDCINTGTILHNAAGCSEMSHVGGIFGSASGVAVTIKNCVNKVATSSGIRIANNPTSENPKMCMGGIIGYTYYPDRLEGCKHFGEVSRKGTNIARCGGFFGSNGGQESTKGTKIFIGTDCRIGGTVRTIKITSDNARSYFGYVDWNPASGTKGKDLVETSLTSAQAYWDGN